MISFYGSLVILEEAVITLSWRGTVWLIWPVLWNKRWLLSPTPDVETQRSPYSAMTAVLLWALKAPAKSGVQHINNTNVSSALKPSAEDTDLALMEGRQIKWTGWSLMYYLAVWNIVRAWLWRYIYQRGAAKQKGDSKGGRGKGWPGTQSCLCGGWPLMDTDPTQKTNTTG